jgi:hypothetical protein
MKAYFIGGCVNILGTIKALTFITARAMSGAGVLSSYQSHICAPDKSVDHKTITNGDATLNWAE